jgi:ParB family chromosome partitioning protein
MATKKTGLGRGLDALLGPVPTLDPVARPAQPPAAEASVTITRADVTPVRQQPQAAQAAKAGPAELPLDLLQPGSYQPRRDMHKETLEELADSIRSNGVLAPISVRLLAGVKDGPQRYEIIAGERRWRAAQIAGLSNIPAIIREVDDEQAAAIALIENLQREDLNPLEEAEGLKRLISEFHITHQEAARAVSKSRTAVTNLLRLLDLCPEARQLLANGALQMGHARALLSLTSSRMQATAAQDIASRGMSVRQTEALVRSLLAGKKTGKQSDNGRQDPDIRRLQDDLSQKLGAKVLLQHSAKGKGRLLIDYNSLDELEGILAHIK